MAVTRSGGAPKNANLSGLGDVVITSPAEGQTLTYNATTGKWENGSEGTVNTPTITSSSGPLDAGVSVTITTSAYSMTPADSSYTHVNTDWQIASDSAYSNILVQSLADSSNKTSWTTTIPTGYGTVYLRVRHRNELQASAYGTRTYTMNQVTTFNSSGTFAVPATTNSVILYMIGGGAAGGTGGTDGQPHGGGGGGYTSNTVNVTPSTNVSVTIGAGGNTSSAAGGTTSFGATNASGGNINTSGNGKTYGANYAGYVGNGAGGGGGAGANGGAAGGNPNQLQGGNGGAGVLFTVDGVNRGGGGGGGGNNSFGYGAYYGGSGVDGGGNGASRSGHAADPQGGAASANRGGGGGGSNNGGVGGSGIVIVKYNI